MTFRYLPKKQGLYDPNLEKDSCGVGFVCNIKGHKSHKIIKQSLEVLNRLAHRGAVGSDPNTGDGAGILIQKPHTFFKTVCKKIGLPQNENYGTGLVFLPKNTKDRNHCKKIITKIVNSKGHRLLGWRQIPVNSSVIGKTARETEPLIEQPFIEKAKNIKEELDFERALYIIRKQIETIIRSSALKQKSQFYITNLSARTFSYKGLLMPNQVENYFLDLKNSKIMSSLALIHSRYSTNTFPTWDLAQPFRFLAHNGEINTLRGNINWMRARESLLQSKYFGPDIEKIKPVIIPNLSDSASLDNAIELLMLSGRSLYHSLMMLIPNAWEHNLHLNKKIKDFYKYHSCFIEPWDGPAAIAVTDGTRIGAVLDRNGLRPARYIVTKDNFVVMASEVGVLDIKSNNIRISGRLEPGKIFFIDTQKGRIIKDDEIKQSVASQRPYTRWLKKNLISIDSIHEVKKIKRFNEPLLTLMKAFGYTREDINVLIKPMAREGKEPTGSMGNDTPHSILSKKHQLLYSYFKQMFAQVTNPAIDPIREELVMSLESYIGPQKNILDETPEHCKKIYIPKPILSNGDLLKITNINKNGLKAKTISLLFKSNDKTNFYKKIEQICSETDSAINKGYNIIVLSDRGVNKKFAALPTLLATGVLHQHLVRNSARTQISIIVESAEPREVHHFALLFGFGAECVNPYLAYEIINNLIKEKEISSTVDEAHNNFQNAINKGILKILSKMGISTLHSYRGAQIFEAIGLGNDVINKCFTGTPSRIGGAGFDILAEETLMFHKEAYPNQIFSPPILSTGGLYRWKRDGEFHLWNPETISTLQDAARKNDYARYKEFAFLINEQSQNPTTLRSLLKFTAKNVYKINTGPRKKLPVKFVEPVENIVKRFVTGAMSFGSISNCAHETLAIAMNRLGGMSNTGEGGENPLRFIKLPTGDSTRSAIKQIASGRFGVNANYLINADEIQIKIAQGAKPGEGGQLPGHKVSEIIARTRYTTPGVTLISPPPHHDIYSIEDLAQLIFDLKNINPEARISVKLVSEIGVGTVAAGVAKGHADMILISGGDGGTGASPLSSIRHAGLPWELGLSEVHQTLVLNGLRGRVRLQTDGQIRTGRDVVIATLLGAEEYGFCTAALILMGCVMLRHCQLDNCSLGVATQDKLLVKRFHGTADHVVNYMMFVAQDVREIMATLGFKTINEMVGRTDLLKLNKKILPWKAQNIDFSRILYRPHAPKKIKLHKTRTQVHKIDNIMDRELIKRSERAISLNLPVKIFTKINNFNRSTGTTLSGEVCKRFGENGLRDDTIICKFNGFAGQSFGAFLAPGITFNLEGMANDYVGKGISGGKIIIYPSKESSFKAADNIIIGNTTFYGAIKGEAYVRGQAGERFCIRNSGLLAVIEGVGDHGCEYMTGGTVLILGQTGRNFAAGMSGGIAFIYDKKKTFKTNCNMNMVELENITAEDKNKIYLLLQNHFRYTQSPIAKNILNNISSEIKFFVKVIPTEYKKILEIKKTEQNLGLNETFDG